MEISVESHTSETQSLTRVIKVDLVREVSVRRELGMLIIPPTLKRGGHSEHSTRQVECHLPSVNIVANTVV
jgi:hypothetical protein